MSHTFESHGITFFHNGDHKGDVEICGADGSRVNVPFEALKDLVADYVRSELIAFAENAPTEDVLLHAVAVVSRPYKT